MLDTRILSILAATAALTLFGCGDSGSGTDMGGADSGGGGPTCAAYCTSISANCMGANRQYGATDADRMASCMSACNGYHWSVGTVADASGNTLGCHQYHAGAAASDATTHCPHAGPLGGGACGASACVDFCEANLQVCTGGNAAYADMGACMTACTGLSDATSASTSPTTSAGNTLACRAYHLSAATVDAATHCAHTNATGGGVCQ